MPFNQKPQKFNAKINPVTIGSGDKTVTIGGDSTFPFYTFDAPSENCAKIGVEISDMGLEGMSEGIKAYYHGRDRKESCSYGRRRFRCTESGRRRS